MDQSRNMEVQLSRFQLFFDDTSNFQLNKPVCAHLRRYSTSSNKEVDDDDELLKPRSNSYSAEVPMSRRNSLVSNCSHSIPRSQSVSTMATTTNNPFINDNSLGCPYPDNCMRHHHRRPSVAIKFQDPQVIDNPEHNECNSEEKETLKNYEIRFNSK